MLTSNRFLPSFDGNKSFAPDTFGAPRNLHNVDNEAFKKSRLDRIMKKRMTKECGKTRGHKFETIGKMAF